MRYTQTRPLCAAMVCLVVGIAHTTYSQSTRDADGSVVRLSILDAELGPPAKYGVERLTKALEARGCRLGTDADAD